MTYQKKKVDAREFIEESCKLSEEDRYAVFLMMKGISLVRDSERKTPQKTA